MTRQERAVLAALDARDKALERTHRRVEIARKALGDDCSHPDPKPFDWEHDNGYGKQTKMRGVMCDLCLKLNHWGTENGWVKRHEGVL